jgi:hypothetical protein
MIKLFLTSFIQIGLVAINTILLVRGYDVFGVFLIPLIWTLKVQKISVPKFKHKIVYALGAGFGAITGYFIINQFI